MGLNKPTHFTKPSILVYMTKQCTKCREVKDLEGFYLNRNSRDGRQFQCKVCAKKQSARCYQTHTYKHKARVLVQNAKCVSYVRNIKENGGGCSTCGESRAWVLDFHHLGNKESAVSTLAHAGKFRKLKAELEKCIILCRNCHADLHHHKRSKNANIV